MSCVDVDVAVDVAVDFVPIVSHVAESAFNHQHYEMYFTHQNS